MAENQFTTITPKNGPQEHLWTRLFRIQGLAEILHTAANTNEKLSGEAVAEFALMVDELSREAMNDLSGICDETKRNIAVGKTSEAAPLDAPQ
jgi:hypothetical protein